MKVKTSELTGHALNLAAARCEGKEAGWMHYYKMGYPPAISTSWELAGPIIERERIELNICGSDWRAVSEITSQSDTPRHYGPTPLVAAMRCYVASRLGDTVEVPDDLVWDELIYEKGEHE